MKRFWLFMYEMYYPRGGMSDCVGSYDTIEEAIKGAEERGYNDYMEILDSETGLMVHLDVIDFHPNRYKIDYRGVVDL